MRGNSHVRFLGGRGPVMGRSYPSVDPYRGNQEFAFLIA